MRKFQKLLRTTLRTLFVLTLFSPVLATATQERFSVQKHDSVFNPFPDLDPFWISPFWNWKTIETEHFRVTYPAELRESAYRSADLLEEAHRTLSPIFKWEPENRTQVLVLDNVDSTNGATASATRFGIILWVTPPDSWSSLNYYDDWLKFLTFHEYAHMLNLDTRGGLWKTVRYIFGDLGLPNGSWAPWMLEGLAVYTETRHTAAGRGRSPYFNMLLRAAVQEGVLDSNQWLTLDKLTGTNPYFPGGDTRYQLGYQLMNQAAQERGEKTLGDLSSEAGSSAPYYINTQLETVSGKDWYQYWDEFVRSTRKRVNEDLDKIRSVPVTLFEPLTEQSHELSNQAIGAEISPNQKWLAYTLLSTRQRQGLYIKNLETGKTHRAEDKAGGAKIAFTPDSGSVIFSAFQQSGQYYLYSDLMVYNLEKNDSYWITEKARLKDPDISPDGKWIVAAYSEASVTGLALLPLGKNKNGKYEVGPVRKIFIPEKYDRASSPRFSKDGKSVFFSFHPFKNAREDLYSIDLDSLKTKLLFSDGNFNRFPTPSSGGSLFFVSDKTGVDNLYRLEADKRSALLTNMETGLLYPSVSPSPDTFYASVFSTSGWQIGKFRLPSVPFLNPDLNPDSLKIQSPSAPAPAPDASRESIQNKYEERNYSVFPSLFPRLWFPFIGGISNTGIEFGLQTYGYDALDLHRYSAGVQYNTALQNLDAWALYSNRTLGPALTLSSDMTLGLQSVNSVTVYSRLLEVQASASYPLVWTYSRLTPRLGFNAQRFLNYGNSVASLQTSPSSITDTVFSFEGGLDYTNTQGSALGLGQERGFRVSLQSKAFMLPGAPSGKVFVEYSHYLPLINHTILIPKLSGLWSSTGTHEFVGANSTLQGRSSLQVINPFSGTGLSGLSIRGYPNYAFAGRIASVAALDLRIPLARIFRGWGTRPVFLNNLYGVAFVEAAYTDVFTNSVLTSTGVGLRLSTELFFLPVTFSADYQQGFIKNLGGTSDLFFQILFNGISF